MSDTISIGSLAVSIVSLVGVGVVAVSNTRNTRTQAEQEAFIRAKDIFKASIEELERRIAALNVELQTEKRASRALRKRVNELETFVEVMKANMVANGLWDVPPDESS